MLAFPGTLDLTLYLIDMQEADMFRLCGVIDMLLAEPSAASSTSTNGDDTPTNSSSVQLSLQATRDAIKSKLLHDTQERLAYRAEAFVKSHIHPKSRKNFRGQDEQYMELLDLRKQSGKPLASNQRNQYVVGACLGVGVAVGLAQGSCLPFCVSVCVVVVQSLVTKLHLASEPGE